MERLIGLFIIITILLLITSFYFQSKKSPLQYLISLTTLVISFILIGIAFMNDAWELAGIGTIGFTLFISAAISFIIIAISNNIKDLKRTYSDK